MSDHKSQPRKTAIQNVRVFNDGALSPLRTVVIDGGIIGSDPDGVAEVIDGNNGVLLPGLIDAHVHVLNDDHLAQLAQHGVTTALDMACWPVEKMHGLRGKAPDIRSAGLPATTSGSVHSCALPLPKEAFVPDAKAAKSWVQHRVEDGSDYIKIIADVPGPSQETMGAIVQEAHKHNKMVVAHASSYAPTMMALDAGVDVITHSSQDRAIDSEVSKRMLAANVISVPTLLMMRETAKPPTLGTMVTAVFKPALTRSVLRSNHNCLGPRLYSNARDSVTNMYQAGIPILAGTDCHEEKNSTFDVKHGESLHQELELLVEAGLSNTDALRAATSLPATYFGLRDRGVVERGRRADLVLLRDDPTEDIRATRSIERVWFNGEQIVS